MTPHQLIELLTRLGWDRTKFARRIGISPSRPADLEPGGSRGKHSRPAPTPEAIALAGRKLDEHESGDRLLTPAERAALWRDNEVWPRVDHVIDDSRDGIYGY